MKDYSSYLQEHEFVIFLFHGVITKNKSAVRNYTRKHLEREEFEKVITDLRTKGNPVYMDEIVSAHQEKSSLPPHSFAISFDDGFANNFHIAAPILKKYEIPAIFYLTSGFIENNEGSWTDLIEYAVERTESVQFRHEYLKTISQVKSVVEKISFLDRVREVVKKNASIDPYQFAREIWIQNGIDNFKPDDELDQKMTHEEVGQLASDPLFTVGGHSHSHRVMSFLSPQDLQREVSASIQYLKGWTGQEVDHYSYPEGLAHCYSKEVITCLKEHGIKCSPSAIEGSNNIETDLFHLKRIFVV